MIVFGLGTGRSGSTTLAHLLNLQEGAVVTHERNPRRIHWSGSEQRVLEDLRELEGVLAGRRSLLVRRRRDNLRAIRNLYRRGPRRLVGDVAFYYLPYVELLLGHAPEVRFVCIRRDEEATVRSFLRFSSARPTAGPLRWFRRRPERNFWMEHDGTRWKSDPLWDPCFPKFRARSKEEALHLYWREYTERALALRQRHPDRFAVFDIEAFQTRAGQEAILDFAGVARERRVFANERVLRRNAQRYG